MKENKYRALVEVTETGRVLAVCERSFYDNEKLMYVWISYFTFNSKTGTDHSFRATDLKFVFIAKWFAKRLVKADIKKDIQEKKVQEKLLKKKSRACTIDTGFEMYHIFSED